ncbi:MAG TPA: thioredoxin domain-containing protein [Patescibacteria group bacterium]|nr:thioredoxin domain-containing protein [Patescibacteria group bacterium]
MNQEINNNLSVDSNVRTSNKWYRHGWGIVAIVAIILTLILVVAAIFLTIDAWRSSDQVLVKIDDGGIMSNTNSDPEQKSPQRQIAEKTNRPYFGNPDAKLVIVEFSDFQCPVCQQEFPIIRKIVNEYQAELLYIYRNYPIIDEYSIVVAQAGLCAQNQNMFWPMHDRLFSVSVGGFNDSILYSTAEKSGLDMDQYDECMATKKYQGLIVEDFQDGNALGVEGTPTFFINGNKLSGAVNYDQWKEIIDRSLELFK